MKSKTTPSIVIALFLASAGNEYASAVQMQNINSRISKLQNLASKQRESHNTISLSQIGSEQPYDTAQEERDNEHGYPATHDLEKKYPGNDHEAITKTAQKFIDPSTGYMKTLNEVTIEEKAKKDKEVQEKIDAAPGLGFKLNTDMVIPDDTGEKYHTTHKCFGSPCPKKDSFVQTGDNYVDESMYYDDTGTKWITFMDTYGRDPHPEYHDPHFLSRPDFKKEVETRNRYPEESFAQVERRGRQQAQNLHQRAGKGKYYLDGDDTGDRFVHFMPTYGADPNYPPYQNVHWMAHPDFPNTVYQKPLPSFAQKEKKDVVDDEVDKWVYWKGGKDPNPKYHDVHYMIRPDFNTSTLQWPRSFAQSKSVSGDDYKYDDWDGDRWVKYPKGQEPFPPPHDPEWYKKDDFMHSIYQPLKPAKSFAQKPSQDDDGALGDWTGDRWAQYAKDFGREPFTPPHDPEWYTKDHFMHSVYQPVEPAKSFAQQKVEDDESVLDDWTGDRWVKYWEHYGREPFPPPHDPDWFRKDHFWNSVYQPQSLVQLDEQYNGAYQPSEPFDEGLKDVDKIMEFYKQKDAKEELEKKEFQLPDDPSGGMGQIAVASIKHSKDEDKKYLQDLLEGYSMGGKGPNGLPNGERVLPKEQMQLATEEVINTWATVSDPAMKLFEKENFDKVWSQYDNFNKGQIDLDDGIPMMRTFMETEAPSEKTEDEKNPFMKDLEKEDKKEKAELISKVNKKQTKKAEKKKKAQEEKESEESSEEEGKLPEPKKSTKKSKAAAEPAPPAPKTQKAKGKK